MNNNSTANDHLQRIPLQWFKSHFKELGHISRIQVTARMFKPQFKDSGHEPAHVVAIPTVSHINSISLFDRRRKSQPLQYEIY